MSFWADLPLAVLGRGLLGPHCGRESCPPLVAGSPEPWDPPVWGLELRPPGSRRAPPPWALGVPRPLLLPGGSFSVPQPRWPTWLTERVQPWPASSFHSHTGPTDRQLPQHHSLVRSFVRPFTLGRSRCRRQEAPRDSQDRAWLRPLGPTCRPAGNPAATHHHLSRGRASCLGLRE